MVAVEVKEIVCINCRDRFSSKPTKMEHVDTVEATGLDNHLIGMFKCPKCGALIGYIFEPVKIISGGRVKPIPIDKFRK